MTTYVYLLSDYDEHGAENVVATLDRGKLMGLIDSNWPDGDPSPHWARTPGGAEKWYAKRAAMGGRRYDRIVVILPPRPLRPEEVEFMDHLKLKLPPGKEREIVWS